MPTTTNLQTLKINYLTQAQYDTALAGGQINANELYFTPDDGSGGGSGAFIAEYGIATYDEVLEAYESGKTIIVKEHTEEGQDEYTSYYTLYQFHESDEFFSFTALAGFANSTNGPIPTIAACMLTSSDNWIYGSNSCFKVTQNTATTSNGDYPIMLGTTTATTSVNGNLNKTSTLSYNPSTELLTNAGGIECGSLDDGYGLNDSAILSEATMELWGNILS